MRKALITVLAIAALVVYSWDALQLVRGTGGEQEQGTVTISKSESPSIDRLLSHTRQVKFIDKNLDPFSLHHETVVPAIKKPAVKKEEKPADTAVKVVITGIMWNPTAPIAMLTLPDGSSVMASQGQSFGDIMVKKIEKNRILVIRGRKDYWISQ